MSKINAIRRVRSIRAAVVLVLSVAAAAAQATTWYVEGTFDAANCGTPLLAPLEKAYPSGTTFTASFTFDPNAGGIYITDGRYDFVTSTAAGGGTVIHTRKYTLTTTSSRFITQQWQDGVGTPYQSLALNGNGFATGAHHPVYGDPGVDLVSMTHSGDTSWFVYGQKPAAPPALSSVNVGQPCLDIFYIDPKKGSYYHRMGVVTFLSDVPPASATR